jgi:hypothetical protein
MLGTIDLFPTLVPFPAPSPAEVLARRPSRRPGRPGPHYPDRCDPGTIRLPAEPDWHLGIAIHGRRVHVAAQAAIPPEDARGVWTALRSGLFVGIFLPD